MGFFSCARRCFSPSLLVLTLTACAAGALAAGRAPPSKAHPGAAAPGEAAQIAPSFAPPVHARSASAILERNPFDSTTGPLDRGQEATPPPRPPLCRDIHLHRVVLSDDPAWSFAEVASRHQTSLLRLGASVGQRRLVAIEADQVRWEGEGETCTAFLQGHGEVSAPACAASGFPLGPPCIVRRSETTFDVAATMVDHVLEQQAELMRCARVVPETDGHGNVTGIRLFGIRRDTLMGALGFENGDALQTINGFDMTSPDHALEAYAKLRSTSDLRVGLTRKGKKLDLEYHLW